MQDMREIPAIVTEEYCDKVLKFSHFWWGYLPYNVSSKQTDLHALNNFSSSIDKVSFKKNSMSLGLVVLEEKLFTRTRLRTPTPQSDDIKTNLTFEQIDLNRREEKQMYH